MSLTNIVIDCTGAPAYMWIIYLLYMCLLLNHAYSDIINGIIITKATGSNAYIILILRFAFDSKHISLMASIPPLIALKFSHYVGIAEHVG